MKKYGKYAITVLMSMITAFSSCSLFDASTSSSDVVLPNDSSSVPSTEKEQKPTELKKIENEEDYEKVFYVAYDGDDTNTGAYDSPFATVEKAKEEVAKINGDMQKDIAVVLREGTYHQRKTLKFGTADSGTNGHDVIYMAYPDEEVSFSGGVKLGNWNPVQGKEYYYTSVSANVIRYLYINGRRATLSRQPNGAASTNTLQWDEENRTIHVKTDDLLGATNFEMVSYMEWAEPVVLVEDVRTSGESSALVMEAFSQKYMFEREFHPYQIHDDMYVYYQNAMEFLDAPGEFYYSKEEGRLYYYPCEGEDMSSLEAIVPTLDSVIKVDGTNRKDRATNIVFDGLTVEHTSFSDFNKYGFMEDQSGHYAVKQISGWFFGYDVPKGAIHIQNAENIDVRNCTVRHTGGTGINFYTAASNCSAEGNYVYDLSSTGILVSPFINGIVIDDLYNPNDNRNTVNHISVKNNYVAWAGFEFRRASAIANMLGYNVEICNNEIAFSNYTGISNGWGWSLQENVCKNNTVSYNDVHHIGLNGSDLGGIYNLNNQPGSVITNNYTHEIQSTGMGNSKYSPADGIYLDEGTNNMLIAGNQIAYANENNRLIYINKNTTQIGENNTIENNKGLLCGDTLDESIIAATGVQEQYRGLLPYTMKNDAIQWFMIGKQSNAEGGLMGYRVKMNEDTTVRGLGRFYWNGNTGAHKVMIYDSNKNLVAYTTVYAGKSPKDKNGFEYGIFETPVTLKQGEIYYIVGQEEQGGDLYIDKMSNLVLSSQFKVLGAVKGNKLSRQDQEVMFGAYVPLI